MPIMGHPKSTVKMPPIKKPVAFSLCRWKKKRNVRSNPMMKAKPLMNKICIRGGGEEQRQFKLPIPSHYHVPLHSHFAFCSKFVMRQVFLAPGGTKHFELSSVVTYIADG